MQKVSNIATHEKPVMLTFVRKNHIDDMARFVNAVAGKLGDGVRGKIKVGINAVNIEPSIFDEIKDSFGADQFGYSVVRDP